jgi:sugar lactone lactonase YvrE
MSPAPFDATPSPDGKQVYYTAMGSDENGEPAPGVYSVAASGGQISRLAAGEPLTAPVNISVSLDGQTLFVADPAASAVFSLPSSGGMPSAVPGTEGYAPRGLTVHADKNGREYVYFTGRMAESEQAGLFRIAGGGGAVETVAAGEPFADPAGVTVDADGVAYVVETSSESPTARVLRVANGTPSTFVEGIGIGFPAGITLTKDASKVLVSGLDPETKRDVVYFVDTTNQQISRLTKTVGQFQEPAGLHRAHNADVFAWADSQANGGTVYVLTP